MANLIVISIFCFLILCILYIGLSLQKEVDDKASAHFSYIIFSAALLVLSSLTSDFFEGDPDQRIILYVSNTLTFFSVDLMLVSFTGYLRVLLGKKAVENKGFLYFIVIGSFIRMAVILVLLLKGKMFVIENGCYVERDLYFIPFIISGIIMLTLMYVIIRNRSDFSRRHLTVMLIYLLLPIIAMVLELQTGLYCLTEVAITLSVILIYVLIQASVLEKKRLREDVLEEIASKDLLTGLNNRRSYYERISSLDPQLGVGIVFCDMNRLKYTNDHFGHNAGDALIKKFAGLLEDAFGFCNVFRISGDEFIAIVPDISGEEFTKKAKYFKAVSEKNDNIASIGYSYGTGQRVDVLTIEAEDSMYADKHSFYKSSNAPSDEDTRR